MRAPGEPLGAVGGSSGAKMEAQGPQKSSRADSRNSKKWPNGKIIWSQDADPCIFTMDCDLSFRSRQRPKRPPRQTKKVVEGKDENRKIAEIENHDWPRRESLHI